MRDAMAVAFDAIDAASKRADPDAPFRILEQAHDTIAREARRIARIVTQYREMLFTGCEVVYPAFHRTDPQSTDTIAQQRHHTIVG